MKTIKGRIARLVIIFGLVSILIVGSVSVLLNYTSTSKMLQQTMTETANLGAERVNQELDKYKVIAMEVGSIARLSNATTALADKEAIIKQRISTHGFVEGHILDENGKCIFDNDDFSSYEVFKEAMKGNASISEPVVNKKTGLQNDIVAAPLWANGLPGTTVVGVIVFIPNEDFLNNIMSEISVSKGSSAYMIDKNGNTIASVDADKVKNGENIEELAKGNTQYSALAALQVKMKNGEAGFGKYQFNNVNNFLAYAPVKDTNGWSFGVSAPVSDFMQTTTNSVYIIIALLVISVIVSILLGFWIGGKIGSPITACTSRLEKLSGGDLKAAVPKIASKDETGILASATTKIVNSLNDMINDLVFVLSEVSEGNLTVIPQQEYVGDFIPIRTSIEKILFSFNKTMAEIEEAAIQVSGGSEQISNGAQALAQGAEEQAASIDDLSTSIMQTSEQIQATAQNAREANLLADEAGLSISDSNRQMMGMMSAMEDIASTSREINKINKTIEDIAFQTNILALNAAVEAARAGQSGKGFAVVADEVRNLAKKSADAANITTELINKAIDSVKAGMEMADKTAEALGTAVEKTNTVKAKIFGIAETSEKQAIGIEQITKGVGQISSVIQSNSATAEESAAASEEFSGQAQMLKSLVDQFKLIENP